MQKNYTNIASIKEHWIKEIAPQFFNFEDVNLYQGGIFGYINNIMGEVTEDTALSVNIARREFYPNTAQYEASFYKMAALHQIDAPMAIPATATAHLLLNQREILSNGVYKNGVYTFVLDNTMTILAGEIPFILPYPIIITARKSSSSGDYTFTSHYDTTVSNSLSTGIENYIPNVTLKEKGVSYLILVVSIRQCTLIPKSDMITKDVTLSTVTKDFKYDGDLANFEVFYKESDNSEEIQLKKLIKNANPITTPFIYYELLNGDTIRLFIKKNPYFIPAFNSTLRIDIYTTLGVDGNFKECASDLICQMKSDKYPYNNHVMITGIVNGSSSGGKNKPDLEEYRKTIQTQYTTNNTLTTVADLQNYFNTAASMLGDDGITKSKTAFRKLRDDCLMRLWGSYTLLKDPQGNVVPTNTIQVKLPVRLEGNGDMCYIHPGDILQYADYIDSNNYTKEDIICTYSEDIKIIDKLDDNVKTNGNLFTSPYLITINTAQTLVGFYLNSISSARSLVYTYVNDESSAQFITYTAKIERNAILGKNYYTITTYIKPVSDLDPESVIKKIDSEDEDSYIRASMNGKVTKMEFVSDRVIATIRYEDDTTLEIPINSYTNKDLNFEIEDGYNIQYDVGDEFLKDSIIAIKKPHDLGVIHAIIDIPKLLLANNHHIPMYVEDYDEEANAYKLCAYIATDDMITTEGNMSITNGIYTNDGDHDMNVSIPYRNITLVFHIFYKDSVINIPHPYGAVAEINSHTLTNSCTLHTELEGFLNLIQQIDYVRSVVSFLPYNASDETADPSIFYVSIDEVPVVSAKWIKNNTNFHYCVDKITKIYRILQDIYLLLENGFGLDMKFYNTYGRAKFFEVGINKERQTLDTVNSSMRFGVYLKSISYSDDILRRLRLYIKEKVELINYESTKNQGIYIMSLISDCTREFDEIGYMEWYGFNEYDYGVQTIESVSDTILAENRILKYIPEFININMIDDGNGNTLPDIHITILNTELNTV